MEEEAQSLPSNVQGKMVREYCRKAEAKIDLAGSLTSALAIKEEECHRFRQDCSSDLVVHAVEKYLDNFIAQRWNTHGTHRANNTD